MTATIGTAVMMGMITGFFLGVTVALGSRPAFCMGRPKGSYGGRLDLDWRRSINHENINLPSGPPPLKLQRRGSNPPPQGRKPEPPCTPPPPMPGYRRKYLYNPSTMAKCGGPCFDDWDPKACDCGALWRDVPYANWSKGATPDCDALYSNPPPRGRKPKPPCTPPPKQP